MDNQAFLKFIKSDLKKESHERVLDTLYCDLHNTANDLLGNTASTDFEWFTHALYKRVTERKWDQAEENVRDHYTHVAKCALLCLEHLQGRVGRRAETLAGMLHELLAATWRDKEKKRKGRRST